MNLLNQEISPIRFTVTCVVLSILCLFSFSLLNYREDDFGIWHSKRNVRIWALEKTSKFLLSHRYIPENYDGIIVGSSVADNIDPRDIDAFKLYNISMAGGNMTEISVAASLYLKQASIPKVMVVSLHPYMLASSGKKSFQIHEKEYRGSLFSVIPIIIWGAKLRHYLGVGNHEFDHSINGWQDLELSTPKKDMDQQMKDLEKNCRSENWRENMIDPTAYQELDALLKLARSRGVKIFAYFHPYLSDQWRIYKKCGKGTFFKEKVSKLFKPEDIVIDFNERSYAFITSRRDLRLDLAHLNNNGAKALAYQINREIKAYLERTSRATGASTP